MRRLSAVALGALVCGSGLVLSVVYAGATLLSAFVGGPSAEAVIVLVGLLLLVPVGLVMATLGAAWTLTGVRLRATSPDAPTEVVPGERVDLEGTARRHVETLSAPLTGEECLAYNYAVTEPRGETARIIDRGQEAVPFSLETDGGSVLVDPAPGGPWLSLTPATVLGGGHVDLNDDEFVEFYAADEPLPPRLERFGGGALGVLESLTTDAEPRGRRRFQERRLVPGETIYVSGVAREREGLLEDGSTVVGPPHEADGLLGTGHGDESLDASRAGDGGDGGSLGAVWRRLTKPPFYLSDTPIERTAWRWVYVGLIAGVLGVTLAGVSAFLLLNFGSLQV